ncbi:hypothetical protein CWB41_13835 [Methylovirgula ligni]|uniref:ParB family chromosome partitioning protein n=1 Tax=Methylovirgula ligni TaxID=569860 RepID=A0A3D9YL59_9HYPH|nr:ParB/RepB/Spo0J family partition protein [Methylovirgula ligni]QAY96674.1 hypothetical protein CWB41_13835 [Methylovirgula ligni]REF83285.1 ParB family chromosome partitioning protein [Methylovirgula ligni]
MLQVLSDKIPLAKIAGLSRFNPRHHHPKAGIAELSSSLHEIGLIDELGVHEENGKFHVLSGGRRFKALKLLAKEGKAWGGDSSDVRVNIFAGSDAELSALALTANLFREQMHPVEEYEAFVALGESMDVAAIARAFVRSEHEVRKSLALGRLAPEIRAAWKSGKLDADTARAFAVSESPEQQAAVYAELSKAGKHHLTPYEIKRRLRVDTLKPTYGEAVFVGEAAYRAAGGRIGEDLFEEQVVWRDAAICRQLAEEKLRAEAEAIKAADGWGFYTIDCDADDDDNLVCDWQFEPDYIDGEEERAEAIVQKEGPALHKLIADPKTAAADRTVAVAKRSALVAEYLAIVRRAAARAVPQVERGKWGFSIGVGFDGDIDLTFGYRKRAAKDGPDAEDEDGEFADEPESPRASSPRGRKEAAAAQSTADPAAASESDDKPSAGVRAILDRTINLAFANAIVSRPDLALAVAVIASGHFTSRVFGVTIQKQLHDEAFDREHPLTQALVRLGADKALALVNEAPLADLTSAFCHAIARSVRAGTNPFSAIADFAGTIIARGSDLRGQFLTAFDYDGYFAAATKDAAVRTIESLDGPAAGAEVKKLKKDSAAARAATLAKARAWLPHPLSDWAAAQPVLDVPEQEAAE